LIKAADRLANLRNKGKLSMYKKEHEEFRKAFYRIEHDSIWKEIEIILNETNQLEVKYGKC